MSNEEKKLEVPWWSVGLYNAAESKAQVCGWRGECLDMRMECRLEYTVKDGLHATWLLGTVDHFFSAGGQIPVTQERSPEMAMKEAKNAVVLFNSFWFENQASLRKLLS